MENAARALSLVMAVTVSNHSSVRKKEEEKLQKSQDLRASGQDGGRADPLVIGALGAVTPPTGGVAPAAHSLAKKRAKKSTNCVHGSLLLW